MSLHDSQSTDGVKATNDVKANLICGLPVSFEITFVGGDSE